MGSRSGQSESRRTSGAWAGMVRFCVWLLLTLLIAQVFLGSSATADEKSRFPKFMRWGKRYNPDYVVVDDSEMKDEFRVPVFGTEEILCKNVATGGVYKCGKAHA